VEFFEAAVRLFRAGRFQEARGLFLEARNGSDRAMALNAAQHVRMCDRRLAESTLVPTTPDEHYDYAVALINSRELSLARQHLQAALAQAPQADHLYYAMALCLALSGDLAGAYENLKRAIELQPKNRLAARQDADFAGIVDRPPLDRLVYPDRKA
jgi:tetratricopeptide (TPR) repeat protein